MRKLVIFCVLIAAALGQACQTAKHKADVLLEIAKKIAEDKMNSSSSFVAHQLEAGKKPNRLIREKSPYLLQHAFNPVDWYPWGEEAFARARAENKPIFLSVGYATCHWCHVMERESFENPEIAALMNEYFINIKVDREERPDVDRVYMAAVQGLTGSGGWPMSVFLTPDLKPFYGGTYFPPKSQYGRPGFPDILQRIHAVWETQRDKILDSADRIAQALQKQIDADISRDPLKTELLELVYEGFRDSYDPVYGGFGEAPKFPRPSVFNFLFVYFQRTGTGLARDIALETLQKMYAGGIYDHLGGGFHRYSVDMYWRVPHFEKMLYDQAQLANSYLDAYQITGDAFYTNVAREILDYVLRDMTSPEGGFYSAEDADSAPDPQHPEHKVEGAFYMWTLDELQRVLGKKEAEIVAVAFGVTPEGNTIADPHGEFGNRNVLYLAADLDSLSRHFHRPKDEIQQLLDRARQKLFSEREKRLRPLRDDKIVTAWNGLMISAFARAGFLLDDPDYRSAAQRAADFLLAHLRDAETNALFRRYRDGEARYPGHLDDYAFLINGLVDLYEATAAIGNLQAADSLAQMMLDGFRDEEHDGFFDSAAEASELLFRGKELHDGAEPSGTAMATLTLLRLGWMLDKPEYREIARAALEAAAGNIPAAPSAYPQLSVALSMALSKPVQIVIAGTPGEQDTQAMLAPIRRKFLPAKVLLYADGSDGQAWLARNNQAIASITPIDGRAAAYVCENFVCELPTTDTASLVELLDKSR